MTLHAVAYVDGFNLYYGALRGTSYRWLDLAALCRRLLPTSLKDSTGTPKPVLLCGIKYFTAPIKSQSPNDHGPAHQAAYLAALREHLGNLLTIHEGFYLQKKVYMTPVDTKKYGYSIEVYKSEEKGSDVNLAVCLVADAFLGKYDVALVVSNDSDLGMAIELVQQSTKRAVGVLLPNRWLRPEEMKRGMRPRPGSKVLMQKASFVIQYIRPNILAGCQLPIQLPSGLRKPTNW